jgi:hypothetical protein
MALAGTTGKKPAPQKNLNISTTKHGNDISTMSMGAGSQNSSANGFISSRRSQVKSMAGGFMQSSNFH